MYCRLDPYAVLSLEAVALIHVETWWSVSGGIEAYLRAVPEAFTHYTHYLL